MLKIWIEVQVFYVCPYLEYVPLTSKKYARQIVTSQMRFFDLKPKVILEWDLTSSEFSEIPHWLHLRLERLFVMQ